MKKEIVKEAISLFIQYGFKSVTMDDIAQHMGVSKKTIYVHFPKKEQLVLETAMIHIDMILNQIISISKHSKDPIIELYQLKKEAMKHLSNEKNSPQYQLQKYYPNIYTKLKEKEFKTLGKLFISSIKKGKETGLFRNDLDEDFAMRIFFNGIRGITDIKLFPIDQYNIDELLIRFSEYHLRAICSLEGTIKLEKYKKEMNL
jgi:AcrR family transcriptional regulator